MSRMLAAGAVAGALLLVVVGRDLILKPEGADQPGAIRLLQLFTYNYRRALAGRARLLRGARGVHVRLPS